MDRIDIVKMKRQIATFLGPTWHLFGDQQEEITNGKIRLWINVDSFSKKMNISARPHAETPIETQKFHKVLFDWIPREMREAWTLSIGCSIKNSEKIANDIARRLLPDAEKMLAEVKRRIAIDEANTETLRILVAAFKQKIGNLRLRESREQGNYRWNAQMLNSDYNEIGTISIDRQSGTCNVTVNGTSIEDAAALFVKRAAGENLIP